MLPYNLSLAARSIAIFLLIKESNLKRAKESNKLWLLLSRIILLVDNVSATLCDISAQVSAPCNDACLIDKVC